MENKTSLMKSVVHDARLIIVTGIMILYILFEGWWSVDAEPRLAADLHRSGFKAQHKHSISAAPSLGS